MGEVAPGIHEIAVKWGLDEVRVLRNLGVKNVPSPIQGTYSWPGRFKPFEHQIATASFLTMHNRAYVFNAPGTGKTNACLWAADYLMTKSLVRRCLIVCPLSIMEAAWMKDLMQTIIHRKAAIAHAASMEKRREIIEQGHDFVIINYDGVEGVAKEIIEDGTFDLVICDEANFVKNANTRRWKAINAVCNPDTRIWALTGTPAPQSPVDAFGLAKLVTPGTVPKFITAWKDKTMMKVSQFKWIAKGDAPQTVHRALQPAIRFTKDMCLDLPPVLTATRKIAMTAQQDKYYRMMKVRAVMSAGGETVTAVNAATVINKLLQISCLEYTTPVLTDAGWLPLFSVSEKNKVWDGEAWVSHGGAIFKGVKNVLTLDGVRMTPEHRVLTKNGWVTAKECLDEQSSERFGRASVRLPDGYAQGGDDTRNIDTVRSMGMPMHLWHGGGAQEPVSANKVAPSPEKLRVPYGQRNAQDVKNTPIQNLVKYAASMPRQNRRRFSELWRTGHTRLRRMGVFFRELLGGYARRLRRFTDFGTEEQRTWLLQTKLPVGNCQTAIQQYAKECVFGYPQRAHDSSTSCRTVWDQVSDVAPAPSVGLAFDSRTHGPSEQKVAVYDILNCGPRNRFVVRGASGELLIVHNCGSVYTDSHETVVFDCKPRLHALDEILDDTDKKVIVFAPYRSSIDTIVEHLVHTHVTCRAITGDVTPTKRGEIFNDFQSKPDPRVLVIQPQAAAHGVTLTAADTVVFWGPVTSVETYIQCIARADRIGQKGASVTVVHLQSSDIEARMFKQLESRVEDHEAIVKLYNEEMKELK